MTFESQQVNEFLVRKAEQQRDRDLRLIFDIVIYSGLTIGVLSLLEAMLRAG